MVVKTIVLWSQAEQDSNQQLCFDYNNNSSNNNDGNNKKIRRTKKSGVATEALINDMMLYFSKDKEINVEEEKYTFTYEYKFKPEQDEKRITCEAVVPGYESDAQTAAATLQIKGILRVNYVFIVDAQVLVLLYKISLVISVSIL